MNKIILIGNLTRDPELRTTPNGVNLCDFTIAVNDRQRTQQGQENAVQYFRITAWRGLGESCAKYLSKGKKCFVSGPLTARTYQANDGSTRVSLEVQADDVEFLSAKNEGSTASSAGYPASSAHTSAPSPAQGYTQQQSMLGASALGSVPSGFTAVETDELPF